MESQILRAIEILEPSRTPYLTLWGVYGTNEASLFARVRARFPGKHRVFDLRAAFGTSNDSCLWDTCFCLQAQNIQLCAEFARGANMRWFSNWPLNSLPHFAATCYALPPDVFQERLLSPLLQVICLSLDLALGAAVNSLDVITC